MKEAHGSARNLYFVPDENGKLLPMIEAIIIVSEPKFGVSEEGQTERYRVMDTLRFHTSPDGLRKLAEQFEGWADEIDELCKKPDEPST